MGATTQGRPYDIDPFYKTLQCIRSTTEIPSIIAGFTLVSSGKDVRLEKNAAKILSKGASARQVWYLIGPKNMGAM